MLSPSVHWGHNDLAWQNGDTLHVRFAKSGQTKKLLKDYAPIVKVG